MAFAFWAFLAAVVVIQAAPVVEEEPWNAEVNFGPEENFRGNKSRRVKCRVSYSDDQCIYHANDLVGNPCTLSFTVDGGTCSSACGGFVTCFKICPNDCSDFIRSFYDCNAGKITIFFL